MSATAKSVNEASRRLSLAIEQLNSALKKLNLGIPVWVLTCSGPDIPGQVQETEEIGYAKVKGKWGICIRLTVEHAGPDADEIEWHFDDAPRDMRLRAAGRLHLLVGALHEEAHKTTQILNERAIDAEELAQSILEVAEYSRLKASLIPKGDN